MDLIEALSHQTKQTRRLLELALTWENIPDQLLPPPKPYHTVRQLTPSAVDELVRRYQAGQSVFQLATHFSVHRITVGKYLRKRGINTKPPALTPTERTQAATLYEVGWSLAELGECFKVSADTISKYLREDGVEVRKRNGW